MPRTPDAKDLPPRKKAQILAQKNSQLFAPSEIAARNGVNRRTVQKINAESLPPDVLAMAALRLGTQKKIGVSKNVSRKKVENSRSERLKN